MPAFTYKYTGNLNVHKVSAQVAGEVCEQLQQSDAGLTPQSLLDFSRDVSSPTHNEFEWDDQVAAEKYRLKQAHNLIIDIRRVTIEESRQEDGKQDEEKQDRAFVVTPTRKSEYVSLDRALTNDQWRDGLLKQARKDSEIFLAKYRRLEELAAVNEAMKEFLEKVG